MVTLKFPYIYPDPETRQLRAALAQDSGLESDYILVGCGADELVDLIMWLEYGMDANKLKEDLAKMGVIVCHYNSKELKIYIQVSVGKPEHTDALIKCLKCFA